MQSSNKPVRPQVAYRHIYGRAASREDLRQVTVDIPLESIPLDIVPMELRRKASVIRFLRLDLGGFLFTCRVPENAARSLVNSLRRHYRGLGIGRMATTREGREIIRVSGEWRDGRGTGGSAPGSISGQLKAFDGIQAFFLRPPEVVGESIRVTLVGSPESLRHVQEILSRFGVQCIVREVTSLGKDPESPFAALTPQQLRILRLAYSLGYYDVPRRASTERLAALLGMDKGTVGRHLRRAERHVLSWLMTS